MASSYSRFRLTPLVNIDGINTFGRWVQPSFMDVGSSDTYIVPSGYEGRVDLISQYIYGTTEYFWAIIAYNSPRNTLNWPKVGEIIKIPSFESLVSEF